MNFFEHQDKARKQSRWIIFAFIGTALLIVLTIDLLFILIASSQGLLSTGAVHLSQGGIASIVSSDIWIANAKPLLICSAITGGIIGVSSLGKIMSLRSGGGKVARDMGAVMVTPDTNEPLKRRLYNVVEEIALASGTPVPEVYVMENEQGINAFAAGYTPADAAVAVTQGTLEKLSRSELQGVIAHEFSHIFNGDMRINIRMMGVIFGIMVIAIIGRKFLMSNRYRFSSSRNKNGGGIVLVGFALMAVGYIGLFFARWMKSALSRQREYLADASAVQFTRDPSGISGALKKIAAYNHASYLKTDTEEVSHMLFSSGAKSLMFSTHPPLDERISRLEKGFDTKEIAALAKKLQAQEQREHVQAQLAEQEQQKKKSGKLGGGLFDVDTILNNIGNPEIDRITAAALMASSLSNDLSNAAHSVEWAPEVLFYCLLDSDPEVQQQQLLTVVRHMGDISEKKLSHLLHANGLVKETERLPLLEISFPMLKRRSIEDLEKIMGTINELVLVDQKVTPFEYLLSRLVSKYIHESYTPNRTRLHGKKTLDSCVDDLVSIVSIIAVYGQPDQSQQSLQQAQKAFKAGMDAIDIKHRNLSFSNNWHENMDSGLEKLANLNPSEKRKVVIALVRTVLDDQTIVTAEHEMLRVVCALINVPMPILQTAD